MPSIEKTFNKFLGLRTDEDPKQIDFAYMTQMVNWNYPSDGLLGLIKILMPEQITRLGNQDVDGMFEYRYLDSNNVLQVEQISVSNGFIFKGSTTAHAAQVVTFTNHANVDPDKVVLAAHTYNVGDAVMFSAGVAGALPASLTAYTIYYVVAKTAGTFQVGLTPGGAVIQFATAGTTPTQYATALPTILKSGLTAGKVSFAIYQDKLWIANGKNYVQCYDGNLGVVHEMGSPTAVVSASAGNPNGVYYYAMTYVTAGGEDVIGSVSNTVTAASKQVTLKLPIGYQGTTSRKIYRTEAGGSTLKLLATVSDNTTLTYTDNTADGGLTTTIGAANNELPKPYFLAVSGQRLYGAKVDKYPTQAYATDTNVEVWDWSMYIDVANWGGDNTAIEWVGFDFSKILVGTGSNIYLLDPSQTTLGLTSVIPTRAYVGIKSGYTAKSIPRFGSFPGGVMFVSTQDDVRVLVGLQAVPVATSLDNVSTDNWAQNIRGDLNVALRSYTNIYAEFFENKYHLIIDGKKYVLDIRIGDGNGWTYHDITTASYTSDPQVMAVMGGYLYNGQSDGWIEKEYSTIKYRGEDVPATLVSAFIEPDRVIKFAEKMVYWFKTATDGTVSISVVIDENSAYPTIGSFNLTGSDFAVADFDPADFQSSASTMDYKVFNIVNPFRWLQYSLSCTGGNISLQKVSVVGQQLVSEER